MNEATPTVESNPMRGACWLALNDTMKWTRYDLKLGGTQAHTKNPANWCDTENHNYSTLNIKYLQDFVLTIKETIHTKNAF